MRAENVDKQYRVLVVDDTHDFVNLARNALGTPYQVVAASGRRHGLETAKAETPDLVIVGVVEPRGDAFKLHKELRDGAQTQNIPILVVDVRPEEHWRKGWTRTEGMQMCAEDYLSRPVAPAELMTTVERILERTSSRRLADSSEVLEWMEEVLKRVEKLEASLVG